MIDQSFADALIDPVIDQIVNSLDEVATARSELAKKCESLANGIRGLLAPLSSEDPEFDVSF